MTGSGRRFGPYEIVGPLGSGGMGEVYRAVDTRLGRSVAIKTLSEAAARDPERRRRFEREARFASAVSHPNVLTTFDVGESDGRPYVVSELLEGETLRARLRPGDLAPRRAVEYGVQIARALEALHGHGIIHRDLKPENLFVTDDGRIKLLDLGLARASLDQAPPQDAWDALTTEAAGGGGTAAYMSPEQVRRQPTDARSDLFSFGIVLYEMLARRRPFQEETAAETMTAILRREPPPLARVDPSLPPALVRVVERCLEKRPEDRFRTAHDLALALEASVHTAQPAFDPTRPSSRSRSLGVRARQALAVVTLPALLAWGVWKGLGFERLAVPVVAGSEPSLQGYDATSRRFAPFLDGIAADGLAFSRDGRWVVYTSYPQGELWRSGVDGRDRLRLSSAPLRAALPSWSPDGTRIAFAGREPGRAWRIQLVSAWGGSIEALPAENVTDPGWTADGRSIVFAGTGDEPSSIFVLDLATRRQRVVPGSQGLFSPRPSPDGRYLAAIPASESGLVLLDWRSGLWSSLTDASASYPAWTQDSAWLHYRRGGLESGFYRIDPATRREQRVTEVATPALVAGAWGAWSGLTPQGAPLVLSAFPAANPAQPALSF